MLFNDKGSTTYFSNTTFTVNNTAGCVVALACDLPRPFLLALTFTCSSGSNQGNCLVPLLQPLGGCTQKQISGRHRAATNHHHRDHRHYCHSPVLSIIWVTFSLPCYLPHFESTPTHAVD